MLRLFNIAKWLFALRCLGKLDATGCEPRRRHHGTSRSHDISMKTNHAQQNESRANSLSLNFTERWHATNGQQLSGRPRHGQPQWAAHELTRGPGSDATSQQPLASFGASETQLFVNFYAPSTIKVYLKLARFVTAIVKVSEKSTDSLFDCFLLLLCWTLESL